MQLLDFRLFNTRDGFTSRFPAQSEVTLVRKSDSALNFKSDVVFYVDAGFRHVYDFNSGVEPRHLMTRDISLCSRS